MSAEHPSFDDLARVADGGTPDPAISAHLSECDICRSDLILLNRMQESWSGEVPLSDLSAERQWRDADSIHGNTEETRHSVVEFAERIAAEDEAAQALLEPLLAGGTAGFALGIARRGAKYRTGGMVRALSAAARDALAENPLKALTLADEAVEIASGLPDDFYPSGHIFLLRGNAWKERANALRFLGESYTAALDAVDHAERAYRNLPVADFYLAVCEYVRATICFRMDRFDEALAHARRAGATFVAFRDFVRYSHARSMEGNILFDLARYAEARTIFEELLAGAELMGERATAATLAINLAATEVELGALDSASVRLGKALEICSQLRLETDAIHARWILATIPLHAGRHAEAAERLQRVLDDCRARNMMGNASRLALDLAEAYALIPRPADVVRVCSAIIDDFVAHGQLTSAMTAFAFLREAAASGRLTTALVHHVKKFIGRLDRQPNLLFLPPR